MDPGSKSTGWAYFRGRDLVSHGTVAADPMQPVFDRLRLISQLYRSIVVTDSVDEVHIEQLVRNTHIYTHWSCGVIGATLSSHRTRVDADVPIQSWQSYVGWARETKKDAKDGTSKMVEGALLYPAESEDERAAVGIGLYYTRSKG